MASGRHIDSESPMFFGYSFGDDFPFLQNAPEPAPGAPLLSDTEQNDLNNWFEIMKSDDRINDNVTGNAIHSENWIDIPQFVGSSSSFGQPQDLQHASLGNHVLPQDVFDNLPMFGSGSGQMSSSRLAPHQAAMASASRSNSSPALPLHIASGSGQSFVLPGANVGVDQSPSDDVVAAANTLLLNGQHGTRHSSFNYGQRLHMSQPHQSISDFALAPDSSQSIATSAASPSALLPPVGHIGGSQLGGSQLGGSQLGAGRLSTSPRAPTRAGSDLGSLQTSSLIFSADGTAAQQVALSPMAPTVHRQGLLWGTDQSFAQKQFTPRSDKETTEALMSVHFKSMECLEPNHSTGATRPSSPTYESSFTALNLKTRTASSLGDVDANGQLAMAPPRKRRKGKGTKSDEADQDIDDKSTLSANGVAGEGDGDSADFGAGFTKNGKLRKRKAKTATNGHPPSQASASPPNLLPAAADPTSVDDTGANGGGAGSTPSKRRRSAAPTKPPRENLTEEQKRENHIKSEQKRRTLIKTGFEDLCILVPGLQGGNLSKSLVLTTAAGWLSDLLEGNKRLEHQLRSMPNTAFAR
ncbi:uncharacterized protein SPSK_00251 [Sporothrix schenckii 1099-18]|nr:uncharacterized protein SPSK_00251 [Sporothrix schenckii 1099-18]KJR83916.1 hypothetical protein SPSK_00251 [Sporothrix schenckii 1099-18]